MDEDQEPEESFPRAGQWQVLPPDETPGNLSASRELVRMQLALEQGKPARVVVGSVELRPQSSWPRPDVRGQRELCYRLKLVRELKGWKVVTERWAADWPSDKRPRSSTLSAENLSDAREEVEKLWGAAVWSALLRASADTLKVIAPFLHGVKAGRGINAVP
ncbi:MAG: hypothetical protein ACYDD4_02675 [Acidimicrobiales bacterium]